jgi:predicted amidohydrolase YtcJ
MAPYAGGGANAIADYHREVHARGSTPMDEPPEAIRAGDLEGALRDGLAQAASMGIVGVTEAGMRDWRHWDALIALRDKNELPIDVRIFVASGAMHDRARVGAAVGASDAQLAIAGVKLYADGWLGPRTCACSEPFADVDPPDAGILFLDVEELSRRVDEIASMNLRPATHAIGDRAIETALDAYERVYGGAAGVREVSPRIEHAQVLRGDLIDRIVDDGVTVCIQPCFAASDADSIADGLAGRFPDAYRWDRLLDAGACVIAGSDFPIEPLDPHLALERLTTGDHPLLEAVAMRLLTTPL